MGWDLDFWQVEIIGRNWLVDELVRAGLKVADPVRGNGVDLLASAPHFTWTLPLGRTRATGTRRRKTV